jgi:uncharacterized protein
MLEIPAFTDIAVLIVNALFAGLARGFSGFGAALIFVPVASAVVGPQVAVPLLLVVDGVMTAGLIPSALKLANRRDVITMSVGTIVGVPAGIWLLTNLEPAAIRWSIVVVVVILLALLISGWRYHQRPKAPLTVLVGLVAGLFSGAAQIGGPPVIAYWLGGAIPPMTVRANIVVFFAVSTMLTAAGYLWSGLITFQILILATIIAPLYGLGVWLGSRMFGVASERMFRHICYAMIAFAALVSMPIFDVMLRRG